MVSVLAFYSDDPSSNTVEAYGFFCEIVFEKNENKQKEAEVVRFFKKEVILNILNSSSKLSIDRGSHCGSVAREVASNSRGRRFESGHRAKFKENVFYC